MSGLRTIEDMELDQVEVADCDKEAISRLEPGDIVFGRSEASTISRIITALDGYWSHAMLYVGQEPDNGPHVVAEATTGGVRLVPVDELRDRYQHGLAALRPRMEPAERMAAAEWAKALITSDVERNYSIHDLGVCCALLLRAGGREAVERLLGVWMDEDDVPTGQPNELRPAYESTCSGLVFRSYRRDGDGIDLLVSVAGGLTLQDGKVRLGPDERALDILERRVAQEGRAQNAAIRQKYEVLQLLRDAAPDLFQDLGTDEFDIEQVVTPGDLWLVDDPETRWLFRPQDAEVARQRLAQDDGFLLESLPDDLARSLAEREAWRRQAADRNSVLEFIVADVDRWPNGSTVRIGFLGGDTELHRRIAEAIEPIAVSVSLVLDTGYDPENDRYRHWSEEDTVHAADIRVSFDQPGYWSLVGTASIDPSVGAAEGASGGRPHQRSLNLGGFDLALPASWLGTVRHEFLHALAFKHEHQNTRGPCQDEFRWSDDLGYVPTRDAQGAFIPDDEGRRPGIYTWLSGPPNKWDRAKVDHNLRPEGAADSTAGPFDAASVMLYRFPPLFYRSTPSSCAPTGDGQELSAGDRRGLGLLYPPTVSPDYVREAMAAAGALAAPSLNASFGGRSVTVPDDDHAAGLLVVVGELLRRVESGQTLHGQ